MTTSTAEPQTLAPAGPRHLPSVEGLVRLFQEYDLLPRPSKHFMRRWSNLEGTPGPIYAACAVGMLAFAEGYDPARDYYAPSHILLIDNEKIHPLLVARFPDLTVLRLMNLQHGFDMPACLMDHCIHGILHDDYFAYGQAVAEATWRKDSAYARYA